MTIPILIPSTTAERYVYDELPILWFFYNENNNMFLTVTYYKIL